MLPIPEDPWRAGETLADYLARRGISRRRFLTFCSKMALVFGGGALLAGEARAAAKELAERLAATRRPTVVWLQLQECTGCLESALRSADKPLEELVLSLVSLNYVELLMAAAGDQANAALAQALAEPHLLVVNGSVPRKEGGIYCTIAGETAEALLCKAAVNVTAILAVGACAHYGCVQEAGPNPTDAVGVAEIITDRPVVNVAGCPPIGEVITATLLYILAYGHTPPTDRDGRPLFAYGQRIHDKCPRRANFDAGQFVERFDDENARKGFCLYKMGCKGPATFAPCPILEWNQGCSFPIKAGHPCLGCTERDFFDQMTPFYRRIPGLEVPGTGVEATANVVGAAMVAGSLGFVAVHGAATVLRRHQTRKAEAEPVSLPILGDTEEEKRSEGRNKEGSP